jgi:hypothetical protein
VQYSLRDGLGQTVARIEVPHDRAVAAAAGIEAYDIGVRLPGIAGRYVVSIDASDGRRVAHRSLPLTVR